MVIKVKYNGEWVKIPYLSSDHGQELVEEAPKDNKQYARQDGAWTVVNIPEVDFTGVYEAIDTKVDKVEGKVLSTNDYITADKTKVTNVNEVIEAAARSVTATGISITLDKRNLVTNAVENIELDLPASTTALAGLMLPSDKTKLNGIAAGAEVNVNADWNATEGDALILNKPTIPTVDVNKEYVDNKLATKSDLPDYTVFDIVMEMLNNGSLSISQENYNTLLEKLPSNSVNTLPVRDNEMYVSSFFGGYNVNGDNSIWFYIELNVGVLQDSSMQISIHQDLTVNATSGSKYLVPTSNGIELFTELADNFSESNIKKLTIHTTGDGTKSLMDDGKYRKLPVYGRNLLLGSGKEISSTSYWVTDWHTAENIPESKQVTFTIWADLGSDVTSVWLFKSGGLIQLTSISRDKFVDGKASVTFMWKSGGSVENALELYQKSPDNNTKGNVTIYKVKLEYGDISTEWTPAWEDIPDLEERYAYGVEWDTASSSPDGVRVGNMQLHRELPIQSKMRMCEVDKLGAVTAASVTGMVQRLDGSIMTEIPEHWYKLYANGTKFRMMLSEIPLPGYNHIDKFYISTYEACISRSEGKLWSENLYAYSDGNSSLNNLRGGDNTSDWDGTYRSLLKRPVTNLTRDQFRQAARKRGSGWEMYTYGAHKTLFWLFAVEYATLNSQKPFNAQKDANGFSQGGLGEGPTQMTDWANFNNSNPLIPCGYTNQFGNGSGEKAYVVKNASDGTHATLMANRYRGIENPFGHIWKYTDGANIQVTTGDSGLSILFTTDDPSNFSDTSYTGYSKKGNICRTNGYAKKRLLGEDGDIVATEVGGSSSTYWCDYYYTYTLADRMQVILVGSAANDHSDSGLTSIYVGGPATNAYNYFGSRICFFPKYKSTEITTE